MAAEMSKRCAETDNLVLCCSVINNNNDRSTLFSNRLIRVPSSSTWSDVLTELDVALNFELESCKVKVASELHGSDVFHPNLNEPISIVQEFDGTLKYATFEHSIREEVFTDTVKHKFTDDGYIIEVESKMEQETSDVGDINIGANASAEEAEDALQSGDVKSGLDIVLRANLEDVSALFPSKKDLLTYAKKHVKAVADKLKQEDGNKAKKFMDDSKTKFKTFVDKWSKDASVFTVGNDKFDPEDGRATLVICEWNEDGMGAKFYLLADALESEKL